MDTFMTSGDTAPSDSELLDALPYGVLALGLDGTVLRANAQAYELVPGLAASGARSCRDIFSCQAAGGPCEDGCFVARAAASNTPRAEIRIDAVGGISPGAMWVTASPLPAGRGTILHLRPGWRGDRRRRSEAVWQAGPELRIHALGRTRVEALNDSLEAEWLSQRPGQILKYLVCQRARAVTVDEIAEAIWPDSGRPSVGNTRYTIYRLRMKLEPRRAAHEPPAFVIAAGNGYMLDRARTWIDADEFERAVREGGVAMRRLDADAATHHFERAMGFYRGVFLADEPYARWADDERNRLAGLATYALSILTALARERDDGQAAVRHLQRLAELEPLDTSVHRALVQALLGEGLRSAAKRRYDSFAQRLSRELGEKPDFDLQSLVAPSGDRARR